MSGTICSQLLLEEEKVKHHGAPQHKKTNYDGRIHQYRQGYYLCRTSPTMPPPIDRTPTADSIYQKTAGGASTSIDSNIAPPVVATAGAGAEASKDPLPLAGAEAANDG